jgi:hypothetical protein
MMTCAAAPALSQNSSARACLFRYSNTNTHANMIEIAGQYVPVLSGCLCHGVWLAPIKRMGITGRNKYVESGGARAGRPDQMVMQSLQNGYAKFAYTSIVC